MSEKKLLNGVDVEAVTSLIDAVKDMVEYNVGALPVLDGDRLVGVFSERDLMREVIVRGFDPNKVKIADVMSTTLITADINDDHKTCLQKMSQGNCRHLPVVEGDNLVGIISDRDLRRPRWTEELDDWTNCYQINDDHRVEHVMTRNPLTVRASDHILEAVKIFREHRFGALPVFALCSALAFAVNWAAFIPAALSSPPAH